MSYIGRFAPSPTGPLHEGSLLTALASYLDAKHHQGRWLLRIEDLDTPRCHRTHETSILSALEAYGFEWYGTVTRQSERIDLYEQVYHDLLKAKHAYWCDCSRSDLKQRQALAHYDRRCLNRISVTQPAALRFKVEQCRSFNDRLLGHQPCHKEALGDFILYRRDQIVAYQLAVVVDDYQQNINHIVRGRDLLLETEKQRVLQLTLGYPMIRYAHLPLVLAKDGQKLSKQTFATPLTTEKQGVTDNLHTALQRLGQLESGQFISHNPCEIMSHAIKVWDINKIPKTV